jgi:cobalamin synthase
MRWNGLRLSVTLLTVIPLRGDAPSETNGDTAPPRATATPATPVPSPLAPATVAAAMAWAPAVGLLLGIIAAAVILLAVDHPLGGRPADRQQCLAVATLAVAQPGASSRRSRRPG